MPLTTKYPKNGILPLVQSLHFKSANVCKKYWQEIFVSIEKIN
jgi:hypothetical protein